MKKEMIKNFGEPDSKEIHAYVIFPTKKKVKEISHVYQMNGFTFVFRKGSTRPNTIIIHEEYKDNIFETIRIGDSIGEIHEKLIDYDLIYIEGDGNECVSKYEVKLEYCFLSLEIECGVLVKAVYYR